MRSATASSGSASWRCCSAAPAPGSAGGYLSLVYTPQWVDNMTAGRGWIALALVVFATWLPWRLAIGALLFGAVGILQLHAQALGVGVPSQFLSALPYLITIVVLVLISGNRMLMRVEYAGLPRPVLRAGPLRARLRRPGALHW